MAKLKLRNVDNTFSEVTTKEYVDSVFWKMHIGTETPADESIYLWIDTIDDYPISFVIEGVTYQADYGMTWTEWIESDYNTISMTIYAGGDSLRWDAGAAIHFLKLNDNSTFVLPTDVIIPNYTYGSSIIAKP